ncbi:hypothetical protein ASF60_01635 [Methylobacterium sp. Leaf113]|uniref:DUF6880 family protein n=1 Tax=Methylobacterium sp. Leaf113 TaxID=1736259 RepID=UPI000700FDD8|nr:DUF6880 family protein [Methylobacterium sp. Leaf113]KQP94913.1 hypothetical protein ASF60_01635 [Methylobacterium sp. Leaf113]
MARKATPAPEASRQRKPSSKGASAKGSPAKAAPTKPKRASRKTTPCPETLTELGLERLIQLVLSETARNPTFKKLVTAAVASLQGPDAIAALVDRRLTALERGQGYIDWQKQRAFSADLDAMLTTVVSELAALDPRAALDRLIRFLGGADDVLGRADDSSGRLHGVYERAADAAASLIVDLPGDEAAAFAARLVPRLGADGHGFVETLMHDLIPRLPETAHTALDMALKAATPAAPPARTGGEKAWTAQWARNRFIRMRQALADRAGDVDAFIAFEKEASPEQPDRVRIAERLLAADRAPEALEWIRRSQKRGPVIVTREALLTGQFDHHAPERARQAVEIRILDTLGDKAGAQALRWQEFERSLDPAMLRAYLAKLPDFEDDAALERAFDHAEAFADRYRALAFLIHWPNPDRAARLVMQHRGSWDGSRYDILVPAAEALERTQPAVASELYRLLIDSILEHGRSAAYGHAARYLTALDSLAAQVEEGRLTPDPEAYRASLRRLHGRKSAFWAQVRD